MSYVVPALCAAGGFAACWFCKDFIVKTVTGAEAFAKSLETKAAAVKAAIK